MRSLSWSIVKNCVKDVVTESEMSEKKKKRYFLPAAAATFDGSGSNPCCTVRPPTPATKLTGAAANHIRSLSWRRKKLRKSMPSFLLLPLAQGTQERQKIKATTLVAQPRRSASISNFNHTSVLCMPFLHYWFNEQNYRSYFMAVITTSYVSIMIRRSLKSPAIGELMQM